MSSPTGNRRKYLLRDPKSPFWQYDFSINGERERGSTRERTASKAAAFVEARRSLMRQRHAAQAMGLVTTGPKRIGLFDACAAYEEKLGSVDATTSFQVGNLCALLCADGRDRMLDEITTADFIRFRNLRRSVVGKRGKPVAHSSINREIELARRVWKHALELGFATGNMPNWKTVILKHEEVERVRELRSDEEARLVEQLRKVNPDLLKLAIFSMLVGQRKSAVVRLRWTDVDFDLSEATFVLKGRGKTKEKHVVPMTETMLGIIISCPRVGPFVFTYECKRNAPRRGDRPSRVKGMRFPFSLQGWSRQWRKALADAGVDDFRWHDLRHTAASRLLRSVNNLKMVQTFLGHKSIEQTARYAHVSKDDLRRGLEAATQTANINSNVVVMTGNM